VLFPLLQLFLKYVFGARCDVSLVKTADVLTVMYSLHDLIPVLRSLITVPSAVYFKHLHILWDRLNLRDLFCQ